MRKMANSDMRLPLNLLQFIYTKLLEEMGIFKTSKFAQYELLEFSA
jgi:hypothetical protein